jgi:hypothetical protein
LRRLLSFVQYRITESKKQQQVRQEAQQAHLAHLDQQIQLFLAMQQYQYQQLATKQSSSPIVTLMGLAGAGQYLSPAQISMAAMKRVLPVISAYTRISWMGGGSRFQGSPAQ